MGEPTTRKRYECHLTDEEWKIGEPLLPTGKFGGRSRSTNIREDSTRPSTCCERDVSGVSCPTTFHRQGPATITFEPGPVTELYNGFATSFVGRFALQRAETRSRAQRASTVSR
jgi:hypothetical protein